MIIFSRATPGYIINNRTSDGLSKIDKLGITLNSRFRNIIHLRTQGSIIMPDNLLLTKSQTILSHRRQAPYLVGATSGGMAIIYYIIEHGRESRYTKTKIRTHSASYTP